MEEMGESERGRVLRDGWGWRRSEAGPGLARIVISLAKHRYPAKLNNQITEGLGGG